MPRNKGIDFVLVSFNGRRVVRLLLGRQRIILKVVRRYRFINSSAQSKTNVIAMTLGSATLPIRLLSLIRDFELRVIILLTSTNA